MPQITTSSALHGKSLETLDTVAEISKVPANHDIAATRAAMTRPSDLLDGSCNGSSKVE
jgi:hypothetical protein